MTRIFFFMICRTFMNIHSSISDQLVCKFAYCLKPLNHSTLHMHLQLHRLQLLVHNLFGQVKLFPCMLPR